MIRLEIGIEIIYGQNAEVEKSAQNNATNLSHWAHLKEC